MNKNRKIAGWVMAGLLTALLVMSASNKLMGNPEMVANFEKWGLSSMMTIIALGELASVLLFLIPRTSVLGTLLLSAYFGGAIVVHMGNSEPYIFQSFILVFIWITAWVRNPEMFAVLLKGKAN
ncbi:MAG TPA: DoxX family protein [Bacteroidales bacterium]|nr:DoxX family protein [Bacteroidales bacterium]